MPTFDALSASGSLNSQTETRVRRPTTLRTASTAATTIDTITVSAGTATVIECVLVGRATAATAIDSERSAFAAYNNTGAVSPGIAYRTTTNGDPNVWSTEPRGSGTSLLSASVSGNNVLIAVTPGTSVQTDWQLITDVMVV